MSHTNNPANQIVLVYQLDTGFKTSLKPLTATDQ